MTHDVLLEELFVELLKDKISLEFLLEDRLNQEHPDFLDADDCLPDPSVIFYYGIKDLPERFGFLGKGDYDLVVLADLLPYLPAQVSPHLLVPVVAHVASGLCKHLVVKSVDRVIFGECFVNQKVVII